MLWYNTVYLTCSIKLTCSQLSPPHHTGQTVKLKEKRTKNKSGPVPWSWRQSRVEVLRWEGFVDKVVLSLEWISSCLSPSSSYCSMHKNHCACWWSDQNSVHTLLIIEGQIPSLWKWLDKLHIIKLKFTKTHGITRIQQIKQNKWT